MPRDGATGAAWSVLFAWSLALAVAGCGGRALPEVGDVSTGGAPGGAPGGVGGSGYGGSGYGGSGYGGSGYGGRGVGGATYGVGGAGVGGRGVGGAGVGGAVVIGCDSTCLTGEMCVNGICRGAVSRWTTLGGDVHHSGFNVNETGTPPISPAWNVLLGGSLWPAVSDGSTVYVSTQSHNVWALSPADGHTLWTYNFGAVFSVGQATVDGGHVYIAQCNHAGGTYMYSFVASTGQLFWSTPFGAQWETYWAPLVAPPGSIYFDGGSYGGLYGLNTSNGAQTFFNSGLEQYDEWSPLLLNGTVYTFIAGNLRGHDPVGGAVTSTISTMWNWAGWSMNTSPVSDGDKIYVISPPNLHAIRVRQGTPIWTANAAFTGMPAVANGVVYAISGGQLRATDANTGSVLWTFAGDSALSYPPVLAGAGQFVYVASAANVYAVKTSTQATAWSSQPGGWLSIAAGQLYVAQSDGRLAAYALSH